LHTPYCVLSGENLGSRFVVPTVAGCLDVVVHIATEHDGTRRVREIVAASARVEGDVVELEPIPLGWTDALVIQVHEMAL
jgi:pilus assembly protein CpaF